MRWGGGWQEGAWIQVGTWPWRRVSYWLLAKPTVSQIPEKGSKASHKG